MTYSSSLSEHVLPRARAMRIFTKIDNRLMFEDFYARLAQHAARTR